MKKIFFALLSSFILLSGCAGFQVAGEIQRGITALCSNPHAALAHFQRAAELDPDYLFNYYPLEQGLQTYLGRAYYTTGNLSQARQLLERARSLNEQDHMAKLYLGLVLAQDGDWQRGLREIETGLRGLIGFLDSKQQIRGEAIFWDPGGYLRTEVQRSLAMIAGQDINGKELIASAEWLGHEFEAEVNRAYRDEFRDQYDDDDGDGGPGD